MERQGWVTRRTFMTMAASGALALALGPLAGRADGLRSYRLVAAPGRAHLLGPTNPDTAVWAYGSVPGPVLRARQGERLRVEVVNRLDRPTTVHWHGLRVPNAMDGVPHLTQAPIAPGATFVYEFDLPDAGTYWYHPHQDSAEQIGRGLYGALIVDEHDPPAVDRELVWVLDDWRLEPDAAISDDFGHFHDIAHGGRVGNIATVNGAAPADLAVRTGERIRLRLVNAANARIFALNFEGHRPTVIAYDGQPVAPHAPEGGRIVFAPGMRVDLILDLTAAPGSRHMVRDDFYRGLGFDLLAIAYGTAPLRDGPPAPIQALAPNPLPQPDLAQAVRHDVVFGGGMMGRMTHARLDGREAGMRDLMHAGMAWAINGVAVRSHTPEPMLRLPRGGSHVLRMRNDTMWFHPMHLHGHVFRVIARRGRPTIRREWQDTVLLAPREEAEIAFVADNPGNWMFHCHILEHQMGGMQAVVRVG